MKKNRIGVLTFHRSLNYGAILQAYALKKSIEKLGVKSEIIDYRNEQLESRDSIKRFYKTKGIARSLFQIVEMPYWFKRRRKFDEFLFKAGIGEKINKFDKAVEEKYDKIFVGSDQVWNYKVTNFDENYFLRNIEDRKKRNSYAASFGISQIPSEYKEKYREYLNDFNFMSVREPAGADIIYKLNNKKVEVVLDPTLLLTKEEWHELASKQSLDYDYIVIYQRAYSKSLIEYAQRLAQQHNCKIVTINGNPRQVIKAKYIMDAGPEEWLALMKNSKFIVTNSFHGVAFSINFNKQFYVELLDEKFGVNSRLTNIIDFFNLKNRMITNNRCEESIIDYSEINKKLEEERKKSLSFLKAAIQDTK